MVEASVYYNQQLYDQYFPQEGLGSPVTVNWEDFSSTPEEVGSSVRDRDSEFVIQEERTWEVLAQDVGTFIGKRIFFPWNVIDFAKFVAQRVLFIALYPAQSAIVKFFIRTFSTSSLQVVRKAAIHSLKEQGFVVRHVVLEKNGIRYSGLLMGHRSTIDNGKWALQATGNREPIEHSAKIMAHTYKVMGCNVLMVNGPSVGASEGRADETTLGDAQDIALSFLETAVKAKKIVIAGRSLGGLATSLAIIKHSFREDVQYLVVRQMTFDRASNVCGKIVKEILGWKGFGKLVKWIVKRCGPEMDSIEASRKLSSLRIKEVIVQATKQLATDEVPAKEQFVKDKVLPAKTTLGYRLVKEGVVEGKVFLQLGEVSHMTHKAITAPDEIIKHF